MSDLWAAVSAQPWLPASAAVLGSVVTIVTFASGNRWDKRTREAIKTELEIAKLFKEVEGHADPRFIDSANKKARILLSRWQRIRRVLMVWVRNLALHDRGCSCAGEVTGASTHG